MKICSYFGDPYPNRIHSLSLFIPGFFRQEKMKDGVAQQTVCEQFFITQTAASHPAIFATFFDRSREETVQRFKRNYPDLRPNRLAPDSSPSNHS